MQRRPPSDKLREVAISWFMRLREAEADDPVRSQFEQWLLSNPMHQQAYQDICMMWDRFDSVDTLAPLASLAETANTRHPSAGQQPLKKFVAGALVAIAIGWGGLMGWQNWRAQPTLQMGTQAALGTIKKQRLDDGTLLTLNTGAEVEVTYYRDRRVAHLKHGEAIFEVSKDPTRPFVVESGQAQITVLGTRFADNQLNKLVRISVDHGTVKVEHRLKASQTAPHTLILHDGEVAEVSTQRAHPQPSTRRAADAFAFEQGMVIFDESGLDEIAETLSRYHKKPLLADTAAQNNIHISSLLKTTAIETFIQQLPEMAPVQVVQTPEATLIKRIQAKK